MRTTPRGTELIDFFFTPVQAKNLALVTTGTAAIPAIAITVAHDSITFMRVPHKWHLEHVVLIL